MHKKGSGQRVCSSFTVVKKRTECGKHRTPTAVACTERRFDEAKVREVGNTFISPDEITEQIFLRSL